MKRTIALFTIMILIIQVGFSAAAFTDSSANPYTGKKYTHDDQFSSSTLTYGIDISYYQRSVDWKKVKADGIDFVILRAAYRGYGKEGNLVKDSYFEQNVKGAIAAGIDVGAYIYSQAITEAEGTEEANFILNIVKDYNLHLPIVFDYEYAGVSSGRFDSANLTKTEKTNIALAFCKKVESSGFTAMVYASHSFLKNDLNDDVIAKNYDIWLANYSIKPSYAGSLYDEDYTYWQYTSSGSVNGASGNIDCNFRYFKRPSKVTNLKINSVTNDYTSLSWSKIKGCYGYQVYRFDRSEGEYKKIATIKGAGKTTYKDTVYKGYDSSYKVRAISYNKNVLNTGSFSEDTNASALFVISIDGSGSTFVTFHWPAQAGADGYEILRATSENGSYSVIETNASYKTHYSDMPENSLITYYYKVRAFTSIDGKKTYGPTTPAKKVSKTSPSLSSVTLNSNSSATVKWKNVSSASGTEIYRKAGSGSYKKIKTISDNKTTSYKNTSLSKGIKYTYKIRKYRTVDGKKYYSNYTGEKSVTTMSTPVVKLKSYSKAVNVSYKKASGASGYQIYMKSSGGKYKLIKTTSKTSYKKTKLTKGRTYYFKVRAYKNVNGKKVYSSYSSLRYAKAK